MMKTMGGHRAAVGGGMPGHPDGMGGDIAAPASRGRAAGQNGAPPAVPPARRICDGAPPAAPPTARLRPLAPRSKPQPAREVSARQRRVRSRVMFFWCASSVPPPISISLASRQELLDAVLGAVAVAAEHLDRGVGDLLRGGRGEQLRGVGAEAVALRRADRRGDVVDRARASPRPSRSCSPM